MTNHHHVIVSDVIQLVISGTCDKPEFNHNVAGGKGVGKEISLYMAAVSFVTYSKHLALFAVIAYSVIIAVTDGCTDDYECDIEMNQVCCNRECVYGLSCVGGYYTFIPIVLAMKVVSAANAHPATAGIVLVLTTLNFPAS